MLLSLALIFILALILGKLFELLKLPTLLGILATGIILGPFCLNLIDTSILNISAELRKIALIIILLRAGFNLDISDIKKMGKSALFMCFVPATFEIGAVMIFAPMIFGISYVEAGIMGTVLAAVSPAVIVPRMINLIDKGYGQKKKIPQLVMAGASVDDIYVMVLFTSFLSMEQGKSLSGLDLLQIPTSIIIGCLVGFVLSLVLAKFFTVFHIRDSVKVILLMALAFIFVSAESMISGPVGFSGLLAVMTVAIMLKFKKPELSLRLSSKCSKLWVCAEILLFALVGAGVNLQYAINAGIIAVLLIFVALIIRIIGVYISLIGSGFNSKEKLFCAFSYIPKATVQAAIGGIPLASGLACGNIVLTVAILAIIITAPIGAILIDITHKKFLDK